ncbi:Orotate phosphoribosyltransferase [Caenorhabditis elegans]|uniref:Orotate phosphoribosyltransferase n=1 Tax=Caenorhabditis elegans TaxID=6239 RepID=PYRE_CAEEL|nr:Orotate phosphoribosyltransferase [Caenorhabditis elegans]O61790.1 RecName: Full=Orotate phosphoribosyltransferase; Short=OPRT; Short=OPRTase; AltName: Full=Uracil phosphoribosyltransferase [Caenorhabditis elegans]CCD65178.1 Orotate phosphoribosyltransferase [Caenorhabditis elegans]|eukprot:NP_491317.1 Orotate phosphoribosyltransferase [Caenorhabditis elegans]
MTAATATANGNHSIEDPVVMKVQAASPIQETDFFENLYQMECFRTGEFYLKSGQMTPIYIDLRRIMSSPRVLRMAAQAMCEKIVASNLKFDYVVGVPYAALPLATLVSDILNVPMLMKRKEAKAYGTKQLIEGVYQPGGTVLLVEDVVTSGESIRETAEAIRNENLLVTDAIAVLDRQQGATANLAEDNLNFLSFLTMEKILDGLITKNEMTEERKHEIIAHLAKPF